MTELLQATAVVTKAASDGKGRVEMLASMDIVDRQDEVVELSAWEDDVREFKANTIPTLVDHDPNREAGFVTDLVLDRRGLFVAAQLNLDAAEGQKTYEALLTAKSGEDMPGVSVGFEVLADDTGPDGRRHITKAALREVSILLDLAPANPVARVLSVKADDAVAELVDVLAALANEERVLKHAAAAAYLQRAHDAIVKAGAKCVAGSTEENITEPLEGKADDPATGKADDPWAAEIKARLDALEEDIKQ